jgi:hypothetical protein
MLHRKARRETAMCFVTAHPGGRRHHLDWIGELLRDSSSVQGDEGVQASELSKAEGDARGQNETLYDRRGMAKSRTSIIAYSSQVDDMASPAESTDAVHVDAGGDQIRCAGRVSGYRSVCTFVEREQ